MSDARPLSLVPDLSEAPVKLSFRDVSKAYTTGSGTVVEAIRDVSFEVGTGEFVCLIGPSGAARARS